MDSGIRQPSQRLVSAAWAAATSAAGAAIETAPDASRVLQHCHDIITRLPDDQQRWVVNALALARGRTRGTANDVADTAIRGAATPSEPAGPTLGSLAAAIDAAEYRVRERVAPPWDQD